MRSAATATLLLIASPSLEGRAVAKPGRWLRAGTRAGLLSPSIGSGTHSRFPTLDSRFSGAQAPGLLEQPDAGGTLVGLERSP